MSSFGLSFDRQPASRRRRFNWKLYMDWNGDDFWCRDAIPTDRPNELINDPLILNAYRNEARQTATVEVTTGFGARTRYGNQYFTVTTVNGDDGINIFKSGAGYDLTTVNGTVYTLVCWVRRVSGLSGSQLVICRTRTSSDTVTKNTVNLTEGSLALNLWVRVEMQFTATASDNVFLQIYSDSPNPVVFNVTGLMYFTGTTPIPNGFNTGAVSATGDLLDGYDNISADYRKMSWFLGMRKPYQDVCDDQTATVTLYNGDQKYTPENTDSPIYGSLVNGRNISIEHEIDGAWRYSQMYVGRCDFAAVKWRVGELAGKLDVVIPFTWYTKMMKQNQVDLPLYTDETPGTIIRNGIIGGVYDLPTNLIEDGLTNIPYYGDTTTQTEWNVIVEMTSAERGHFLIGRDGRAMFWDRHHLFGNDTITATVNSAYADTYPPNALEYQFGASLKNVIRVKANQRHIGTSETLWELDHDITIPVSSTTEFWIQLRRDNGQFAASGTLVLSGATYSAGTTTNVVTEYGGRAKLSLQNVSATVPAVLTALTVEGAPQTQQNALEYIASATDENIFSYGRLELAVDMFGLSTLEAAMDVANFELLRRQNLTGDVLWISYKHASDGTENYHQYTWEIGDRITLILPEFFHEREYIIMGEEHTVDVADKKHHVTKFYLEPAYPLGFWSIGVAGRSEIGETTYVGY